MTVSVSRLRDRRFNGYLKVRLPHPLDAEVKAVVVAYWAGSAEGKEGLLEGVDGRVAGVLNAYAQRMASIAVRTGSVDDLRRGVVAAALAHGRLDDYRNSLFVLSTVHDSASLIGTSLGKVLDGLKGVLPPAGLDTLRTFDRRDERSKSLKAFGRRRSGAGDTFRYV
ncbi:hypothetical protein OG866_25610 [Streptomyces sp. NBC_00663]|uniref:hypothetical protein n=1 Tax=Streptomyces sp. NBC_00663 TaxID=2975801 RepID=UPI002E2FB89D|nr:hypothetical protein [Streptomyces sp. NBC_00663]